MALQAAVPEDCRRDPWWVENRGHNDITDGSEMIKEYVKRLGRFASVPVGHRPCPLIVSNFSPLCVSAVGVGVKDVGEECIFIIDGIIPTCSPPRVSDVESKNVRVKFTTDNTSYFNVTFDAAAVVPPFRDYFLHRTQRDTTIESFPFKGNYA
eukprot:CCRYP_016559-RA/>CCRYP_016559-RA protein AED:0.82 eAED:0.37 QI:0/0/0/0.5/1/1/2/0/152